MHRPGAGTYRAFALVVLLRVGGGLAHHLLPGGYEEDELYPTHNGHQLTSNLISQGMLGSRDCPFPRSIGACSLGLIPKTTRTGLAVFVGNHRLATTTTDPSRGAGGPRDPGAASGVVVKGYQEP